MKNDELEDILERFEYWKYVKMGGVLTDVLWEKSLDREQAIQALTSWKDKEVEKAKLRLINTEIRKLQKNEVWYRFDDCVWELKQTRKRITKSLQSQGGK